MDETIILNWNNKVPHDAHIFILGDFMFTGNIELIRNTLSRLNGFKHLIMGNHDYQNKFDRLSVRELFASTHDYLYINVEDEEIGGNQGIFLCHYPMHVWNNSVRGSWQLFGHIHSGKLSTSSEQYITSKLSPAQYDVGVDNNDFTPISYDEVKTIITKYYLRK